MGLYWLPFLVITSFPAFPLTMYASFYREHQYGLAAQTFGGWFGDQMKALGLSAVFGALLIMRLYTVLRRTGRMWWLWGAAVTIAFSAFVATIGPVYLAPLFNTYQPSLPRASRSPDGPLCAWRTGIVHDGASRASRIRRACR